MTAEAAHTCDLAIARNPDDAAMHDVLLMVDIARRDTAGVNAQLDWSHAHPGALDLQADEIDIALASGEIRHARSLLHELNREQHAAELEPEFDAGISRISRLLADEGLIEDSAELTKLIPPSTVNEDLFVALAEDGMTSRASEALAKTRREHPHSTLWTHVHGPEVEAAILLAQHKPGDALSALEPALGFEKTTFGDNYLRGEAYLQTGQFARAVSEYKTIIDSPWIDPTSNLYPLSFLEMARAQVQLHDLPGAKASYAQFLQLWKTADPGAEQLLAAKREMKSLP
jgi:tetratricopeptide (TPR) repeat protein